MDRQLALLETGFNGAGMPVLFVFSASWRVSESDASFIRKVAQHVLAAASEVCPDLGDSRKHAVMTVVASGRDCNLNLVILAIAYVSEVPGGNGELLLWLLSSRVDAYLRMAGSVAAKLSDQLPLVA